MRNFMPAIMLVRVVMDNDHNSLPLFGVFVRMDCGLVSFRTAQACDEITYLYHYFFMSDVHVRGVLRIIMSKGSIYG